jgi:hypothetical protein
MANQLNPFAPSHEPEPPIQENARVRRNRSSRTVAEPVDNTPGAPLSEGFFGTHFLMGGKRFDLTKPDFLFGKNEDLDLLGGPVKVTLTPSFRNYKRLFSSLMAVFQKRLAY